MAGLTPQWTNGEIKQFFTNLEQGSEKAFINAFMYVGEQFINNARRKGTYTDRTGNLRSSIGYVVLVDGKVHAGAFRGTAEGEAESMQLVRLLQSKLPGIVLVCLAGMNYAAAVESKGYDVITGSTPTDNQIGNDLRKLCEAYLA